MVVHKSIVPLLQLFYLIGECKSRNNRKRERERERERETVSKDRQREDTLYNVYTQYRM